MCDDGFVGDGVRTRFHQRFSLSSIRSEMQISEQNLSGQILFTYLHLAADRAQAEALMKSGAHAIAYETVVAHDGSLPLLTPMSEVAGRMSVQVGATLLQKAAGGSGVLIGGVPGHAADEYS